MRLIYLTQLFDPEPTFKGLTFVKALAAAGHEVEVVTGFPNYPGGKVYDGYEIKLIQREVMDGVAVTRLPIYPSHDGSGLKRMLSYFSFFFSALFYLLFVARRADIILVYYPSLTAGMAAAFARIFRRTPVVLDIQDMWPDSLPATGMIRNRLLLRIIGLFCRLLYAMVDHVMVLSNGFKALLVSRGLPETRVSVVYNWAEEFSDQAVSVDLSQRYPADHFNILFAGNMGIAQGLGTVVEAAKLLESLAPKILIHFLGTGVDVTSLKAKAQALGLRNVVFHPRVPLREVQGQLRAADILLVHLVDDPLFRITIPSKTQAYLYAAKPVIMAVLGEAADLIKNAEAGFTCPPQDAVVLAHAMLAAARLSRPELAQLGQNGRNYYDRRLSFAVSFKQVNEILLRSARR